MASAPDEEQVSIQAAEQALDVLPAVLQVAFPDEELAAIPAAGQAPDVTPDAALGAIPDEELAWTEVWIQEQAEFLPEALAVTPPEGQAVIPASHES